MRWINHSVCTLATVYAATGNGVATWLAWAGAVLPDAVELPLQGLARHRGCSHWPYPYLAAMLGLAGAAVVTGNPLYEYLGWVVAGAVLHLFQDLLSPRGIPLRHPLGERTGLNWYRPFASSEALLVLGWVGVALAAAGWRGALAPEYLFGEGTRALLVLDYLRLRMFGV